MAKKKAKKKATKKAGRARAKKVLKKKAKKKVARRSAKKAPRRKAAKKTARRTAKKAAKKAPRKKAAKKKLVKKKAAKKTAKKTAKKKAAKAAVASSSKVAQAPAKPKAPAPAKAPARAAAPGSGLPAVGTQIKDYRLPATRGLADAPGLFDNDPKKLSELAGPAGLVLYFYPKDNTPGCTVEACEFRDNLGRLKSTGFNPVGVSADDIRAHERFTEKQKLNFPLIADEDKVMLTDLGLWVEKKLYGRSFMGIPRTTLVLDRDLRVLFVYEKVKPQGHVDQIMADLSRL